MNDFAYFTCGEGHQFLGSKQKVADGQRCPCCSEGVQPRDGYIAMYAGDGSVVFMKEED